MKKRRPFADHEVRYILRHYPKVGAIPIAKRLARTARSVSELARRHGVRTTSRQTWTAAELRYLKENYPRRGRAYVARALGRTLHMIRQKAADLGLRRVCPHCGGKL